MPKPMVFCKKKTFIMWIILIISSCFAPYGFAEQARLRRMMVTIKTLDEIQARITEEERVLRELAQEEALMAAVSKIGEGLFKEGLKTESVEGGLLKRPSFIENLKSQLGRAQLRSSIVTEFKYDDNYYQFPDKEKGDFLPRINTSHYLRLPRGESYIELNYSYNSQYFLHRTTNKRIQAFRFTSLYKPSRIFSWELTHEYERVSDLRIFDTDLATQVIYNQRKCRTDKNTSSAVFTYMPGGRHNLVHLRLQHEELSTAVQEDESQTDRVDFDFERYLNPTTSLLLGFNYQLKDERSWGQNDEREENYFLGLRRDLSNLTKFTGRFTYNTLDYKNTPEEVNDDEFHYTLNLDLYHRISPFTDISFNYIFKRQKKIEDDYRMFLRNEFAFVLNHYFLNGLSVLFNPRYKLDFYSQKDAVNDVDNDSRKRNTYSLRAGLNYRFNDWLNLGLGYTFEAVHSGLLDEKYTNNTYSVELRGDF